MSHRYHRDAVRPSRTGGNTRGGVHTKLVVATVGDSVLLCEPTRTYISKRGPTKPKPPRLSKNGVPLGRKRTKPVKQKQFDGLAYALFLEDLCAKAREALNLRSSREFHGVQDGFTAHWTQECQAVCLKYKLAFLDGYPARSPGCNAIENLFGTATREFDKQTIADPPKDSQASLERFRQICGEIAARGDLGNTARSMNARLSRIIAAGGGPTKD